MSVEQNIRHLIAEIEDYFATLSGEGAAKALKSLKQWSHGAYHAIAPADTKLPDELSSAVGLLRADGHHSLASAISGAVKNLEWITYDLYPLHEIGEAFAFGHSYCSIIGENSPIVAQNFDLGLFIIKPDTLYRDHKHKAPELYAPLTGPHGWRFAKGDPLIWKEAHHPVWNEPYQHHATKTGHNPFLCIYCWTGDINEAATVIPCDDWQRLERELPAIPEPAE